jgi:WD40 repeat protein
MIKQYLRGSLLLAFIANIYLNGLPLDATLGTFSICKGSLSYPIYTNVGQGEGRFNGVQPFAIAACPTANYIAIATDFANNNTLLVYPYNSAQGSLGVPSAYTDNLSNFGFFSFDKMGNYIVAYSKYNSTGSGSGGVYSFNKLSGGISYVGAFPLYNGGGGNNGLTFSSTGKWFAIFNGAGGTNFPAQLFTYSFDTVTGSVGGPQATAEFSWQSPSSISFNPASSWLAAGTDSGNLLIGSFNESTGVLGIPVVYSFGSQKNKVIQTVAWSPDGNYLVTNNSDNTIDLIAFNQITGTASFITEKVLSKTGPGCDAAFSPDGRYLVIKSFHTALTLYPFCKGSLGKPFVTVTGKSSPSGDFQQFVFSLNSKYLFVPNRPGTDLAVAISPALRFALNK